MFASRCPLGGWLGLLLPSCQQTTINPPLLQSISDVTFPGLCGSVTFPYFVPNKDGSNGAGPVANPLTQKTLNQREARGQQVTPGASPMGLWPPAALATLAAYSRNCDAALPPLLGGNFLPSLDKCAMSRQKKVPTFPRGTLEPRV